MEILEIIAILETTEVREIEENLEKAVAEIQIGEVLLYEIIVTRETVQIPAIMTEVLSNLETIVSREIVTAEIQELMIEVLSNRETIADREIASEEILGILVTAEIPKILNQETAIAEILEHHHQVISHEKQNTLRKTIQNIRIKVTIKRHRYLLKKPERLDLSGFLILS